MHKPRILELIVGLSVAAAVAALLAIAYYGLTRTPKPEAATPHQPVGAAATAPARLSGARALQPGSKAVETARAVDLKIWGDAKPAIFTIAEPAISAPRSRPADQPAIERMQPLDLPATSSSGYRGFISHPELPPGVAYASDTDPVIIERVEIAPNPVRLGGSVSGRVITSSNAASVTAQIGAIVVAVPKTAPGTFTLTARVPTALWWPKQVGIVITAARTDGMSVVAVVPVDVAR